MDDDELRQKFALWLDNLERVPVPAVGLVSRRLARRRARNVTLAGVAAVAVLAGSGLAARALVGGPDRTPAGPSFASVQSTDNVPTTESPSAPPPTHSQPTHSQPTTIGAPSSSSSTAPSGNPSTSPPSTTPTQNPPSTSTPSCSTARASAGGGTISVCPGAAAAGATVTIASDGLCGAASLNNLTLVFLGPKAFIGAGGGGVEIPVAANGHGFHATFRIPASYPGGGALVPVTPGPTYSFDTYPAGSCHVPFTVTGKLASTSHP